MAHIDDVPADVTAAGQDHNYTGPTLAAVVLVSAPVDAALSVAGLSRAPYDAYIAAEAAAGRAWTGNATILDPRRPFALGLTYDQAAAYNYARITINGRPWYLFIDDVQYASLNSTVFNATVDPFPTYQGWALGHSYIERSHAAVAASQGDTYGDQYCEAPEPITAPPALGVMSASVLSSSLNDWTVIVISANDLRGNGSGVPYFELHTESSNINQTADLAYQAGIAPTDADYLPTGGGDHGFSPGLFETPYPWHDSGAPVYYAPSVKPSKVSTIDGVTQGGGAYLFTPAGYTTWLETMQGASWIMEGIVDVLLVPSWAVSGGGGGAPASLEPTTSPSDSRWIAVSTIPNFVANVTTSGWVGTVLGGWRDTYLASVGAAGFRKLITGAHTRILVGSGDSITEYEPDLMRTSGVTVRAKTGAAHGEQSIRVTADYNELTDQLGTTMAAGGRHGSVASGYGRAAGNTGSAVLGLTNSAYTSYLTRKAMGYNFDLAEHLAEEKVGMNMGIIGVQSVLQAATGAAMAGMVGAGPAGAVVGATLGGGASLVTAGISSNNSLDLLDVSQAGSIDIGSYQLAANGAFNAMSFRTWVQALRAVSGRGHGAALASAWRHISGQAFEVIILAPKPDHVRQLLTAWRRYGYMVGRAFKPARLDVMTRYSYWKTQDAVITGPIPQADRQRIADAFDRGITLYGSLSDIGNDVSGVNDAVAGFTY